MPHAPEQARYLRVVHTVTESHGRADRPRRLTDFFAQRRAAPLVGLVFVSLLAATAMVPSLASSAGPGGGSTSSFQGAQALEFRELSAVGGTGGTGGAGTTSLSGAGFDSSGGASASGASGVGSPGATTSGSSGSMTWPVAGGGRISQYFHSRHGAIDIAAPRGTTVRAGRAGTVTFAGWRNNGGGYQVWIRHNNNVSTTYNHMNSVNVRTGTYVSRGQRVGRVGTSGYATGPHLHFEVWIGPIWNGGYRVNPLRYTSR